MAGEGLLELDLRDVYGDRLEDTVTLRLRNQRLGGSSVFKRLDTSKRIKLEGLESFPHALYSIKIEPTSYMPSGRFVDLPANNKARVEIHCAVDPDKVVAVEFPELSELPEEAQVLLGESDEVLGFEGECGEELFEALDDIRRAGLLNIIGKSHATVLANGNTVLSYLERLLELRGDRFFAVVPHVLREEVKNSVAEKLFRPVSGALHHPPKGYDEAGSFKTEDSYGNLQITFFAGPENWMADIDIDDAAGLKHVFQVLDHWLTDRTTHPFDIHEILVLHQRLDPGYRLLV